MVVELEISQQSKQKLQLMLKKFPELIGGGLGCLKNQKPATIKLKEGWKPHASRYYNLLKAYHQLGKKELLWMSDIGVLKHLLWDDNSLWSAPTFMVPKKMGDLCIVTDFQNINACIEWHPFPLPRIIDQLQQLQNFVLETAIDLSQGFYTIPLDKESQKICAMVLPWSKYAYTRMPKGVACAPDMFQLIN